MINNSGNNWGGYPHFFRLDASGNVVPGTSKAWLQDGYVMQRVVDIVADPTEEAYYIICQVKPEMVYAIPGPPFNPPAVFGKAAIRVLRVDNSGSLTQAFTSPPYRDNITIFDNNDIPTSLVPIHGACHQYTDGNGSHKILYICGFSTDENIMMDAPSGQLLQADFNHDKKAFVLSLDIGSGIGNDWNVENAIYFDYPLVNPPPEVEGYENNDFDIAMRVIPLNNDEIFVTGSVCGQDGWNTPLPARGATMNIVLSTDLNTVVNDDPFMLPSYINGNDGIGEYGIGLEQGANGEYYLVGNMAGPLPQGAQHGFDLSVASFHVTHLNGSGPNKYDYTSTRFEQNNFYGNWAIQTLASSLTPINANGDGVTFLIAGLMYDDCGGGITYPASTSSIHPWLYEFEAQYDASGFALQGSSLGSPPAAQVNIYTTSTGTLNYWHMGGGASNVYWHPTFAARRTTADPIIMNAPRDLIDQTFHPYSVLSIKAFDLPASSSTSARDYRNESGCGWESCLATFLSKTIGSNGLTRVDSWPEIDTAVEMPEENAENGGTFTTCANDGAYKNATTLRQLTKAMKTSIYPNPAQNEIMVRLDRGIKDYATVRIELQNIYGQMVASLYSGQAINLISALKLPDVANGLYLVRIFSDGEEIHKQRLVIQK